MSIVSATVDVLTVGLPADVRVFHSRVTDPVTPDRFVVVTGGAGIRSAESYTRDVDTNRPNVRLTITAVLPENSTGTPGPRAEWMAARCEEILTGSRITLPGKYPSRLVHELTRFMGADEDLAGLVSAYYVADFSLTVSG